MPENPAPVKTVSFKPRLQDFAGRLLDSGFVAMATLCGVLLVVEGQGWVTVSPPLKILYLAAWCPLFWGKYWVIRTDERTSAWFIFVCATLFTIAAVVGALAILIKLVA